MPPPVVIDRRQAPGRPSVVTLRFTEVAAGWEQWILLSGDRHHDNTHCDHKLERRHLEEARARNALILDIGDLHCVMQGKWDPRKSMSQCPPELRVDNYLDAVGDHNAGFYLPYADLFALLSPGNHEDEILKRHQVDLTAALAKRLQAAGSPVQVGTYRGWVRFSFTCNKTQRVSVDLHYTHGYGGGGPVTRDTIQAARQLAYLADADIIISSHTHDTWHHAIARETLNHRGDAVLKTVDACKLGTYKDEFTGSGWVAAKGLSPKVLGAYWLRFYFFHDQVRRQFLRAD